MKRENNRKVSLNLNKQTIAFLNNSELNFVKGGTENNDQTQLGSVQSSKPCDVVTTTPPPSPSSNCITTKGNLTINQRINIL